MTRTAKRGKTELAKVTLTPNLPLRAMILAAINAGLGNTDCGNLQFHHIDLKARWLEFPRPKTGNKRKAKLWPETCAAVRLAIAKRPDAKDDPDDDCVFLNRAGRRMVQEQVHEYVDEQGKTKLKIWKQDYVSSQFRNLLRELGFSHRKGLGFYCLRRTFTTEGLDYGDRDAVRYIDGHLPIDVTDLYNDKAPSDERLEAVSDHVRAWLFQTKLQGELE